MPFGTGEMPCQSSERALKRPTWALATVVISRNLSSFRSTHRSGFTRTPDTYIACCWSLGCRKMEPETMDCMPPMQAMNTSPQGSSGRLKAQPGRMNAGTTHQPEQPLNVLMRREAWRGPNAAYFSALVVRDKALWLDPTRQRGQAGPSHHVRDVAADSLGRQTLPSARLHSPGRRTTQTLATLT